MDEPNDGLLTEKQRAFVAFFLETFNATEAAKRAGYSPATAQEQGSRLLSNVMVATAIKAGLDAFRATAEESLTRTTRRARASFRDFFRLEDGKPVFDLAVAFETGAIDNVKKLSWNKFGPVIELHDAHEADTLLLRVHGRLSQVVPPPTDTGAVLILPSNGRENDAYKTTHTATPSATR